MRRSVITLLLGLTPSGLCAQASDPDTVLRISTGSEEGVYQIMGRAIAGILNEDLPGWRVEVIPSGGSVENVRRLVEGRADLAIVQNDVAHFAFEGEEMFAVGGGRILAPLRRWLRPERKLRAAMGLQFEDLLVIARSELGFESVEDIRPDLGIVAGAPGSGTLADVRAILARLGVPIDESRLILVPPRTALPLMARDSVDVIFLTAAADEELFADIREAGGELLAIPDGLRNGLIEAHSYFAPARLSTDGDTVEALRIRALLLVRAGLPNRITQRIVGALRSRLASLRSAHSSGADIHPETLTDGISVQMHPGAALVYCRQDGIACGSSPEAERGRWFVTLIALLGLAFASLSISTRARTTLLRLAPRLAAKLVGPSGVTGRFRFALVPVLVIVMLLIGSLFVQRCEKTYALANNEHSEFMDMNLADSLLWLVVFTSSGFEDDRFPISPLGKLTSALMGVLGIGGTIIFVGLLSSERFARSIMTKLQSNPVTLRRHTIVCGWNDRAAGVIRTLAGKQLGDRRRSVVVVAELDKDPVLGEHLPPEWVVFVRGSPHDLDSLLEAGLATAETVVVLTDDRTPREHRDAHTLVVVSQVEKYVHGLVSRGRRERHVQTVVELADPANRHVVEGAYVDQVICSQEFVEQLLAQSALNPGLSHFVREVLFIDEQNEIIEVPVTGREKPGFVGLTFDEALARGRKRSILLLAVHRRGAPRAIESHESPNAATAKGGVHESDRTDIRQFLTNPFRPRERDYRIEVGDSLLFLAESEKPLERVFGDAGLWPGWFTD